MEGGTYLQLSLARNSTFTDLLPTDFLPVVTALIQATEQLL